MIALAATAAAVATVHIAADAALVAAAAEQDEQNDDPQTVVAAEAIVVIHEITSEQEFSSGFTAHSMLFRRPDLVTIVGNGLRAVPHRPQQKRNGT